MISYWDDEFNGTHNLITSRAKIYLKKICKIDVDDPEEECYISGASNFSQYLVTVTIAFMDSGIDYTLRYHGYGIPISMITTDDPQAEVEKLALDKIAAENLIDKIFKKDKI